MVSQSSLSLSHPGSGKMHQFFMSNAQFGDGQHLHQYLDAYGPMPPPLQMHMLQEPPMSDGLMDFLGASNQARFQGQKLSLSLGYIVPEPANVFGSSSSSQTSYRSEASALSVTHSKFLKPAQMLLDEVVNVGSEAIDSSNQRFARKLSRTSKSGSLNLRLGLNSEILEKQEQNSRLLKLIALLEEVEKKYEQYYNQLEEMVSAFETVAGLGAGKSYAAQTVQAMSRHFSCLRDAILSQIQAAKRQTPRISSDLSQLNLFEHEGTKSTDNPLLRSIGMVYTSRDTWRPIRGLPDTSIHALRTWLFKHFLHPYPTEAEKVHLSSLTGLSKTQVANWFINARVRLWKPMIEVMYQEECADEATSAEGCADSTEDLSNKE